MTADVPGEVRVWPSRTLINLIDPRPEQINLLDIAWALARQCRYNGHVEGFISVAEHSMYVAKLIHDQGYPPAVVGQGLMHDASEAYLGDVVGPLKHLPEMAAFRDAEDRMEAVIRERFGLPAEFDPIVKWADQQAGWEERSGEGDLRLRERTFAGSKPIEMCVQGFVILAAECGIE